MKKTIKYLPVRIGITIMFSASWFIAALVSAVIAVLCGVEHNFWLCALFSLFAPMPVLGTIGNYTLLARLVHVQIYRQTKI